MTQELWLRPIACAWGGVVRLATPIAYVSLDFLYSRDLRHALHQREARVPINIREADTQDIDLIVKTLSQDPYMYLGSSYSVPEVFPREPYLQRLERGEKCYLAFVAGEIAHINWTCFSWGDAILGHPIVLRPGEIYTTDAMTLPKYRGLGIHAAVLSFMLQRAKAMGCHRAITMSSLDHFDSYKIFTAMGWHRQGCVFSFRFRYARHATIARVWGSIELLNRNAKL